MGEEKATDTPELSEPAEPRESSDPPELAEGEVPLEPAEPAVENAAPVAPAPKKRGRPRKDDALAATPKAPVRIKAAPPKPRAKKAVVSAPPPSESSDEELFARADLESEILQFLVQRKTQQQDRRRQLWSQLAGL